MLTVNRFQFSVCVFAAVLTGSLQMAALQKHAPPVNEPAKSDPAFDSVVDKIAAREAQFVKDLADYYPIVETYIQNMRADRDLGRVPISDQYFLGRMRLETGVQDIDFLGSHEPGTLGRMFEAMNQFVHLNSSQSKFIPAGFAQMIIMDMSTFDRQHYDFKLVRREFLGEVRTLVIDVQPKRSKSKASKAMFIGRIWVEDQQYNVVRFNGTFTPNPPHGEYLHFDSWRFNMGGNGQWLPAYVYSEETDLTRGKDKWDYRAQTLLWGYYMSRPHKNSEFTDIVVESPDKVKDQSASKQDLTTVEAERAWKRQAEDNILDRLQKGALLAPEGEADKVLNTVVQNIEITNKLDNIEPEIRCRILLTQPMESFTVGNTIVISRGLLDALPDEASLAAFIAREMGHILSAHDVNEKYAFSDALMFPDEAAIGRIKLKRSPQEEEEANEKGLALLQNSPYKDKLSSASLFFAAVKEESPLLPKLLQGHFGNSVNSTDSGVRMSGLLASAAQLQVRDVNQIAALPLGGRIKLDPWSNQLTIQKSHPVRLLSAHEKMPFEITPRFPYLTRQSATVEPSSGTALSPEPAPPKPESMPNDRSPQE